MRDKLLILGGSGVGMLAASVKNFIILRKYFLNDDPKIKYIGNYKKFKIVGNL